FGPVALACVLWRRTTEAGVVAGMLTGGIVTVVWKGLSGGPWGLFDLYEIVPAFAAGGIAIAIVSLLGGESGKRATAVFDRLTG
ncbi:MAG: sodium:proline symporter, partial [Gammaproteobacteria bacterium]|nr:sodium:proline symporter [Gammaproteobacteria bacterium]